MIKKPVPTSPGTDRPGKPFRTDASLTGKTAQTTVCPACGPQGRVRRMEHDQEQFAICRSCGLQWLVFSPHHTTETVNYNYYMDTASYGDPATYPPFVDFFRFLETRLPSGSLDILDVGCGTGIFLKECQRRGHRFSGIEADAKLARVIPESIRNHVVFSLAEQVLLGPGDSGQAETLPGKFDVITFWDSLEHFSDPFVLLDHLKAFLKPQGLMYVRTNNSFDVFNLFSQALLLLVPALGKKVFVECFNRRSLHYWNFSRLGLTRMLADRNYAIIQYGISDTPAFRLAQGRFLQGLFNLAYFVNRVIGGGKIADVYLVPMAKKE